MRELEVDMNRDYEYRRGAPRRPRFEWSKYETGPSDSIWPKPLLGNDN
jgi:hypothetical protein